jgi:hypothetical protein
VVFNGLLQKLLQAGAAMRCDIVALSPKMQDYSLIGSSLRWKSCHRLPREMLFLPFATEVFLSPPAMSLTHTAEFVPTYHNGKMTFTICKGYQGVSCFARGFLYGTFSFVRAELHLEFLSG